jgi:hypothetical protein
MTTGRTIDMGSEPNSSDYGTRDSELIQRLEQAILRNAGGPDRFKREVPILLRKAIDEVIDSARTGRFTLDETEINERIYLGVKVRIQMRNLLKLPKGKVLDSSLGGAEVGIQSTINQNWAVPLAMVGNPCFLVRSDERHSTCSVGITVIRKENLNACTRSSRRQAITAAGLANIHWILKDEQFPALAV